MTIHSIGATGRDYATVATWAAACPADLTSPAATWEGEMYNDAEFTTTGTVLSGAIVTDATHNMRLRCATGQSFKDSAGTVALDYNQANGVAFKCSVGNVIGLDIETQNTTVNGIQFKHDGTTYATIAVAAASTGTNNGTGVQISQCIIRGGNQALDRPAILFNGYSGQTITNCLIIAGPLAGAYGLLLANRTAAAAITVTACTVVKDTTNAAGTSTGVYYTYNAGAHIVKGCAVFGFTSDFTGTWAAASGHNACTAASAPGSSNQTSKTYANQFTSTTNDWRLKTGNDCAGNSIQYSETSDIDIKGRARSHTAPSIGAWEQAATGSFLSRNFWWDNF